MSAVRRALPVLALGLLLSGCASGAAPAGEASTSALAETGSTTTASASPYTTTPTPTPTSPAVTATCSDVLTAKARSDFESAGYVVRETLPGGPDSIMASMIESGGISCYWLSPGDDVVAWFGQVAMDEDGWATLRTQLMAKGFTESNKPIPGTIQGGRSGDAYPALVHSGGVTYYVGYAGLLSSVLSLQ
jgi:hypothetical protein